MSGQFRNAFCALSSVEEHFLHTEGVAGSSPAARTISNPQQNPTKPKQACAKRMSLRRGFSPIPVPSLTYCCLIKSQKCATKPFTLNGFASLWIRVMSLSWDLAKVPRRICSPNPVGCKDRPQAGGSLKVASRGEISSSSLLAAPPRSFCSRSPLGRTMRS